MPSIRKTCMDKHIHIVADFDRREIHLFAAAKNLEKVSSMFNEILECERRLLKDECIEKCLFTAAHGSFSSALFGSGAEIKHLELNNRCLTVEIFHPCAHEVNDKELILLIHKNVSGIANFSVFGGNGQDVPDSCKWGKVTFLKPEDVQKAIAKMNGFEFHGGLLKVVPAVVAERKNLPFSTIRTKVCWPRRPSKGVALVDCSVEDVEFIINNFCPMIIGGDHVHCSASTKGDPIISLPVDSCAQALVQEIAPFMPGKKHSSKSFQIEVFQPEPRDLMVRAAISFDKSLHLEAAKALDHIQGKVLPGCFPWQKIECQDRFHSSISCMAHIFSVIRRPLESLLKMFELQKGVITFALIIFIYLTPVIIAFCDIILDHSS